MKYNKNEVTGKMRDRIILQNVNRSRSLTGFASESWADTATIWAFAESKLPGSNETIIDGKNTAKNVCDFTIRYISTITEESRVVWGDKLYQVKNLKVSHDRRFISFQGVFYDSYILRGVNVDASVNGIGTTSANLKLIMSVIGQANASASTTATITKIIEVSSLVNANASLSGDINFVQKAQASLLATGTTTADLTVEAAASLLLDLYPNAATAYSLRKLRTAYSGSAIRVRRSSDNTEQDIGFTGNDLNTTALTTFVGAGNGFVTTWYDQSGNARNATQTTQANQPQIVVSGTVLTQSGKPIMKFTANSQVLNTNAFALSANRTYVMTLYNLTNVTSSYKVYLGAQAGGVDAFVNGIVGQFGASSIAQSFIGSGLSSNVVGVNAMAGNAYFLLGAYIQGSSQHQHYRNGALNAQNTSLAISPTTNTQVNSIMFSITNGNDLRTNEAIIWNSYQSTNRVGIETNINTYYAIY
jgi:SPP1 family predicted phage head-tail adaptor